MLKDYSLGRKVREWGNGLAKTKDAWETLCKPSAQQISK